MKTNKEPQTQDFKVDLNIPKFGTISITIYETPWNQISDFMQKRLLWVLVVMLSGGAISARIWGLPIAPPAMPPQNPPTQIK